MEIELAVFDMAGTTVLDRDGVSGCFRATLAEAGLEVSPAAINEVMGLPKREAVWKLIEQSDLRERLRADVDTIHKAFVGRMMHYYKTDPAIGEIPGTSETFAILKRAGIRIGLDTGFSRDIAQIIIDRLGWEKSGLIDASVTSDEVTHGRPAPDMIWELMSKLHVKYALNVAKIGDTPVDLQQGNNAGCPLVIGVTSGTHTREQLARWPHTHLINSVADLPPVLGVAK